jgi:hypothetical protein
VCSVALLDDRGRSGVAGGRSRGRQVSATQDENDHERAVAANALAWRA